MSANHHCMQTSLLHTGLLKIYRPGSGTEYPDLHGRQSNSLEAIRRAGCQKSGLHNDQSRPLLNGRAYGISYFFKTSIKSDQYLPFNDTMLTPVDSSNDCNRYDIRVGRSKSPKGPFVDMNGVDLVDGGGCIVYGSHDYVYAPGGRGSSE